MSKQLSLHDQKQRELKTRAAFLAFACGTGEKPVNTEDAQLKEVAADFLYAAFIVLKDRISDPKQAPRHFERLGLRHGEFVSQSVADLPQVDRCGLISHATPELLAHLIGVQARSCLGSHDCSLGSSVEEFETELGLLHFYPFLQDQPLLLRSAKDALIAFDHASAQPAYDGSVNELFDEIHTILQDQSEHAVVSDTHLRHPSARICDIRDEITRKWLKRDKK